MQSVDDAGVLDWFLQRRRTATGSDFAPLSSAAGRRHRLRIARRGRHSRLVDRRPGDSEPELIRRFFDGIEKYTPQLVSWNGGGFDLPVLNHRALIHGVTASQYWDWGDDDREFRYNNYLARFHTRHLDLMDVIAQYQPRASAGLDAIARLCGFPGKLGMDGSEVGAAIAAGRIQDVRSYCECDVAEHVPRLPAVPADARRIRCRRIRARDLARARAHRRIRRAALASIHAKWTG